jgi:alpha-L-fucosidase 2
MFKSFSLFALMFLMMEAKSQWLNIADKVNGHAFDPSTFMWYDKPAKQWDEALPVGNGRLGAMIFGTVAEEKVQFNEDTYWTGGPYSTVVKGGYKYLPEIQQLVFNQDSKQAQLLFGRHLMGYPVEQQKYQSMGNIHFLFEGLKDTSSFFRWLDIETGVAGVEFSSNGIQYHREIFSSAVDSLIVIRFTASKPKSISCAIELRGERNQAHSNYGTDYFRMNAVGNNKIILNGRSADYLGIKGQLRYEAHLAAINSGGGITNNSTSLMVKDADTLTVYLSAATNFIRYDDVSGDEKTAALRPLKNITAQSYAIMKEKHIADYQHFFKRVKIRLPVTESSWLPVDERLKNAEKNSDPALAALAYQFGRYVLISSSRPGTQPANLQGIWNADMNPAWDAKYTTNINTQMNYWAVESANLSECAEPLIRLIKELTDQGTEVAREHYGAKGWVAHQNTDLWRVAAPMDGPAWGTFTTGGAWLTTQLWEHYRYTGDIDFLNKIFPVIKGSVTFFMDFLVPYPGKKWMVTNPSTSPENFPADKSNGPYFDETTGFIMPGTTICAGSTIDMQILKDLFSGYINAAGLIGDDTVFVNKVKTMKSLLVPSQVGKDGSLQEWTEDWGQLEKEHRHFSHLYGLYPGNVLSPVKTPDFMVAVETVLNKRGDGSTGWSRSWKTACWARLKNGERCNSIIKKYFAQQTCMQLFGRCGKPMQVDATLGMTAAITEMLIQSNEGYLEFLPALPVEWMDGSFEGVKTRGAFEVELHWKNNRLQQAVITSLKGNECIVKGNYIIYHGKTGKKVKLKTLPGNLLSFSTVQGGIYQVLTK